MKDDVKSALTTRILPVSMTQYPLYATYPGSNLHPFYNYYGTGYGFGQGYGNYYGYQPWMAPQGNPWMNTQSGNPAMDNCALAKTNGHYANYQQMNSNYGYPQYNFYQHPWNSSYALTNWLNPQQTYQMVPWNSYYNYNQWPSMRMNFDTGMYYSWPMMNYYSNQMMFPNYLCPSPTYWGIQQTIEVPSSESKQKKTSLDTSESKTVNVHVTSSDVIRDYNLPPAVAKKTRSDIPRPSVDCSDIRESEKSKDDMETPYLFRISDTSIKQIASSRSFGPSMVYHTDSDNKPSSANW